MESKLCPHKPTTFLDGVTTSSISIFGGGGGGGDGGCGGVGSGCWRCQLGQAYVMKCTIVYTKGQ